MKKFIFFLAVIVLVLAVSCSSNPKVTRVDSKTQTDLSGYWNDTDVRIVCESLINDCLNDPKVAQEIQKSHGKKPVVLVGRFINNSSEHIDTGIIADTMEITINKSGKMDFVAGGATRDALRTERQDQQTYSSEETAAALGKEAGADFMLFGTVRTIVDKAGRKTARTYVVSAGLTNIETNTRLWMGQSEIKKIIVQPRNKL